MGNDLKISKARPSERALDYEFLRKEGLKYIEQLSHRIWTDYNTHDSGITIHELLCYAITDLGNRISAPIKDILAQGPDEASLHGLPTAKEILPSEPVTENDFRKLLIDLDGVKNAWVREHKAAPLYFNPHKAEVTKDDHKRRQGISTIDLRGLYDVLLEGDNGRLKIGLINEAKDVLNANRNLCEDFIRITKVQPQEFVLCAEIEVLPESDVNLINAHIVHEIQKYLSPSIRFYSLSQMLDKGRTVAEIFQGPVLENGFIDDHELEASSLREEIRISDIINIIMDIKGVVAVKDIKTGDEDQQSYGWVIPVEPEKQAHMSLENFKCTFFKDFLNPKTDPDKTEAYLNELRSTDRAPMTSEDIPVPRGTHRDLGSYYSIQNHFPLNYGVGEAGAPEPATEKRKAQVRQLRAYLLFFDQVLANYFTQLGNAWKLFSLEDIKRTYFTQEVAHVKDPEELYKDHTSLNGDLNRLVEDDRLFLDRRNRFLDHLLARFSENFNEYVWMMFSIHPDIGSKLLMKKAINTKTDFLRNYAELSSKRAQSFNYAQPGNVWNTDNITGLERRVARLLGIRNFKRRNLFNLSLKSRDYEIYPETVSTNTVEYRFKVLDDEQRSVLLSSSTRYPDEDTAFEEMTKMLKCAATRDGYELLETSDNRFYFNIIDNTGAVIGRRIEYFESEEEREEAIEHLLDFISRKYSDEGMFVIEHILLRPKGESIDWRPSLRGDCSPCELDESMDPYSFRVSIILPEWSNRFTKVDFRPFVEKTLRLETPAHILPKICWAGAQDMAKLEKNYAKWIKFHADKDIDPEKTRHALDALVRTLSKIRSVHSTSKLSSCTDITENQNLFFLGKNGLGTQKG